MAITTRSAGEDGDEVKRDDHPGEAVQKDRASPELGYEEPRETGPDESNAGTTKGDAIGRVGADAGLLKEVGCIMLTFVSRNMMGRS